MEGKFGRGRLSVLRRTLPEYTRILEKELHRLCIESPAGADVQQVVVEVMDDRDSWGTERLRLHDFEDGIVVAKSNKVSDRGIRQDIIVRNIM